MFIVDTYAWVEYFKGSECGRKVAKVIDDKKSHLITLECCLFEIKGWALRAEQDFERIYTAIRQNSDIEPIFTEDWLEAAQIRHEMREKEKIADFGLVDALIVAKQRGHNCKVLSGDRHFKGFGGVVYVGE